jgi:hypothetical protein
VTDAEWDACADPRPTLESLPGRATDRKQRLFGVACCRRLWRLRHAEPYQRTVVVAEQFAEGATRVQAVRAAHRVAAAWIVALPGGTARASAEASAVVAREVFDAEATADLATSATEAAGFVVERDGITTRPYSAARSAERAAQAALLRDVLGPLPFRPAPAVDPSWLRWNGGTVAKLAAAIYDGRRFADLPILADALEDAGCADAAILAHCRGGGEHVRGCWAVDLLTGRR